jgi:hypothetical protein
MTTETKPCNTRIIKASEDLASSLLALELKPGEYLVRSEVIVRDGVPRKWKSWAEPEWVIPDRNI